MHVSEDMFIPEIIDPDTGEVLPEGDAFHFYPAVNAAWVLSEEPFLRNAKQLDLLKLSASYGISGWDGNLSHELWRQSFGNTNAHGYYFSNNVAAYSGLGRRESRG